MTKEETATEEGDDEASSNREEEMYELEPARLYLAGINIPKEPEPDASS